MASRTVRAMQYYHLSRKVGILIISIVLAKGGLSLEEIGLFEMLMYLGMLFGFFWVESLIKGFLSLFNDWPEKDKPAGIYSIYMLFFLISLTLGTVFYLGRGLILPVITGEPSLDLFTPFLVYLVIYQPAALTPYILQLKERVRAIINYSTMHTVLLMAAVVIPIISGQGLEWAVYGLIIFACAMHIVTLMVLANGWKRKLAMGRIKNLLIVSTPIVLYAVIQSFSGIFDAWLVNYTYGDKASFAIFRFGARELPLVVPLVVGVSNLAIPMMAANMQSGLEMVYRESRRLILFLLPIGAFIMLISHWAFRVVYSPDFIESASIFNIYLLIILSQVLFPQTIFLAKKDNHILVRVAILEVGTNIILSLILVNYFGMLGIALATFIAFAVEKFVLIMLAGYRHGVSSRNYIPWALYLTSAVLYLLVFALSIYQNGGV